MTKAEWTLPDRIWVERDEETNEKRWFTVRGMGEEYVRASALSRTVPGEGEHWGGPPLGYHPLPEGTRCRCVKLWQDGKGNHWCCRPVAVEFAPAPPAPAAGEMVEAVWQAFGGEDSKMPFVRRRGDVISLDGDFDLSGIAKAILASLAAAAPATCAKNAQVPIEPGMRDIGFAIEMGQRMAQLIERAEKAEAALAAIQGEKP